MIRWQNCSWRHLEAGPALFKALAKDRQWGKPIARRMYAQARPLYHPLVTRDLDKLGL